MARNIDNCSCFIVGKDATTTGKVLVGHNEDDSSCVTQLHKVPRMTHKEGDVITFDDGPRVIPEVPETYAYCWSEVRGPGGATFADGFANEFGVIVVTNSCVASKESEDDPQPKGIGDGLRRLIAERAKTAREGVQVAADLLAKYGYRSARAYTIADKDEAWVFMATTGRNYVAQRVGDDQIFYVPNWYNVRKVDFSDTEHMNFYWSDTLVEYPLKHSWYKPAVEGDYSDFDFSEAYITEGSFGPSNILRSDLAWSTITGEDPEKYRRTFSIKAPKKYSPDDLKALLRMHYTGWEEDLKSDPRMSPHRFGICRDTTVESLVVEFNEVTELTCLWKTTLRPCTNPYVPFYLGMTKVPD